MSFNGSGTYSLPVTTVSPASGGTTIDSADMNTLTADLETALRLCLTEDGQNVPTANLPMATKRHTGVGDAAALTDYASANQVVDNTLNYCATPSAVGTDAYVVSLPISPGAYVAGNRFQFIPEVANTGACTVNFNSIGVKNIKLADGNDPYDNAIQANVPCDVQYDGTSFILQNPFISTATIGAVGLTGNETVSGNKTFSGANTFSGDNTFSGILTLSGTIAGASPFVFEGNTLDAFETTIAVTDPTADRTQTLPDASGEIVINNGGAIVQSKFIENNTNGSTASTSYASLGYTAALDNNLQKTTHKVRIRVDLVVGHTTASAVLGLTLHDGTSTVHNAGVDGLASFTSANSGQTTVVQTVSFAFVDSPGTVTPKTYTLYGKTSSGTMYIGTNGVSSVDSPVLITIEEIIA